MIQILNQFENKKKIKTLESDKNKAKRLHETNRVAGNGLKLKRSNKY